MLGRYLSFAGAIVVALGIFWFCESNFAESFQSCIRQQAASDAAEHTQYYGGVIGLFVHAQGRCTLRLLDKHDGFFAALAGLAVAAFTFTLWQSTEKLWEEAREQRKHSKRQAYASVMAANAARKSAKVAEETLRATQRAYVSVHPMFEMEPKIGAASQFIYTLWFRIENKWSSPAVNLVDKSGLAIVRDRSGFVLDYEVRFDDIEQSVPTIVGLSSAIETSRVSLEIDDTTAIARGDHDLLAYGWVEWDDVIPGSPRRGVEWCLQAHISGVLVPGLCKTRFAIYGEHNRYYDCPPEIQRTGRAKPSPPPDPLEEALKDVSI